MDAQAGMSANHIILNRKSVHDSCDQEAAAAAAESQKREAKKWIKNIKNVNGLQSIHLKSLRNLDITLYQKPARAHRAAQAGYSPISHAVV